MSPISPAGETAPGASHRLVGAGPGGPPVPRLALRYGFAGRYRRHARACWGRPGGLRRIQLHNHVEVTVDAPIDAVWDVVRDVTRVGEWSGECVGARWLDGSLEAAPGARFRGRNRSGWARWGRICEIDEAEPYALVWRTVPSGPYLDSVRWRLELAPADGGTRISQRYEDIRAPSALVVLFAYLVPSHRDRTAELVEDLQRLGAVAAG